MNSGVLALIGVSVGLSSAAQLVLKAGMGDAKVQAMIAQGHWIGSVGLALTNVHVITGLTLYGLSVVAWLWVLARIDVTMAYPFVGVGFVLTMLCGAVFLDEVIGPGRVLGTLLIAVGVALVARS